MKHLKKYERYVKLDNLIDLSKIKKYVVTTEKLDMLDNRYYLDEIINIEKNNDDITIKNILFYEIEQDLLIRNNNETEKVNFSYFDDMIFSSDNYNETEKYFNKLVNTYKVSKNYNL